MLSIEHRNETRDRPFFSILIPIYNRTEFLGKCIDSILENDFLDMEIMISDDCSPRVKEIFNIINLYRHHKNICFYSQPENLGWSENRNFLVDKAKGKYVILLGDDDKLQPYALKKLKTYIENEPCYDLYCFGYNLIDEQDRICYACKSPLNLKISIENYDKVKTLYFSDITLWIFHPFTICYKRQIAEEIRYNKKAHIGDDILFLLDCIAKNKRIFVIPEVMFSWRKIQNLNREFKNLSSFNIDNVIARKNILDVLEQRNDLQPYIAKLVSSYSFRKRFLYDSIVTDKSIVKSGFDRLNLKKKHLKELRDLHSTGNYFCHRLRIKSHQMYGYIKLFGFKGVLQLVLYGYYKLRFKIRMIKLK